MPTRHLLAAALFVLAGSAGASDLPAEISGRWSWNEKGLSQAFALEDIRRTDAGSFSANLTWWTINPRCAIRSVPISGRIDDKGLSFDARTACDATFTAELQRSGEGWQGKATTTSGDRVVVEISAK
ncbi:MAG: hypothetical protein F9K30_17810 [Dechloromonas sp.]|nr:MAG: hypothetical protein F9K30_17810 [Dechloromonas sp.]